MQTDLIYKTPAGDSVGKALAFCASGISGAEAYVFLRLEGASLPEGRLFCAEDADRNVVSVLFLNGDRAVRTEAGVEPYTGVRLLRFAGKTPPPDPDAVRFTNREALAFYTLLDHGSLTPQNEARYVYRARAMRESLAEGRGVVREGAPVSFAFIVAQNLDSALIGDVYTLPACRGRGYGKRSVRSAVRAALEAGRTPYVLCGDETAGFYEALGFALCAERPADSQAG